MSYLILNEPPPLDEDNLEEETGNCDDFNSGLNLDISESPANSPRKPQAQSVQSNLVKGSLGESGESPVKGGESVAEPQESTAKLEPTNQTKEFEEVSSEVDHRVEGSEEDRDPSTSTSSSPLKLPETDDLGLEPPKEIVEDEELCEEPDVSKCGFVEEDGTVAENDDPVEEEGFDEFADFEAFKTPDSDQDLTPPSKDSGLNEDVGGFGDFNEGPETLPSPTFVNNTLSESKPEPIPDLNIQNEEDDDDFDDFQEFKSTAVNSHSLPSIGQTAVANQVSSESDDWGGVDPFAAKPTNNSNSEENKVKLESLIKNIFGGGGAIKLEKEDVENPSTSASGEGELLPLTPIDHILKNQNASKEWTKIKDFEGSQSLVFKWINCLSHQKFFKSLNVDITNYVCCEKLGTDVPKFAANLVYPLQPIQAQSPSFIKPIESSSNSSTPPELNQDLSMMKTPTSSSCDKQRQSSSENSPYSIHQQTPSMGRGTPYSPSTSGGTSEVQWIINQIPDLSFIKSKTLVYPS